MSGRHIFLSTPSARRATSLSVSSSGSIFYFYPRPPRGGRPELITKQEDTDAISIHALREEGDPRILPRSQTVKYFYPRPPRGGRRGCRCWSRRRKNFYPRPPRGGRRPVGDALPVVPSISIHALREEGDTAEAEAGEQGHYISIHALREEGDQRHHPHRPGKKNFYPRPPRGGRRSWQGWSGRSRRYFYPRPPRGGRQQMEAASNEQTYFYPRPPRGGRRGRARRELYAGIISIHALREEGDTKSTTTSRRRSQFLSTPSTRRATHAGVLRVLLQQISIHALREEGDLQGGRPDPGTDYFYPRPPRGGRLTGVTTFLRSIVFLSTPSARRATQHHRKGTHTEIFLSTPSARRATPYHCETLLGEKFLSTPSARRATTTKLYGVWSSIFLSTPSARRATRGKSYFSGYSQISIHALREEGDPGRRLPAQDQHISIHALREEGDAGSLLRTTPQLYFYPRPPRGGRLCRWWYCLPKREFLSTPSARRATSAMAQAVTNEIISIHALREEGDAASTKISIKPSLFLSTPSARRATRTNAPGGQNTKISIHALREEGDTAL